MDKMKTKFGPAKEKASGYAVKHGDKLDKLGHGLEKAAKTVDEKTKHKYSSKIQSGTGKAKGTLDRLAHPAKEEGGTGGTPPAS
ncbi:antitoxin [Streptomyces sannanensis]